MSGNWRKKKKEERIKKNFNVATTFSKYHLWPSAFWNVFRSVIWYIGFVNSYDEVLLPQRETVFVCFGGNMKCLFKDSMVFHVLFCFYFPNIVTDLYVSFLAFSVKLALWFEWQRSFSIFHHLHLSSWIGYLFDIFYYCVQLLNISIFSVQLWLIVILLP